MGEPVPKPELVKELQAMTSENGAAVIRYGDRTFVVVEVDSLVTNSVSGVYEVTDPDEIAALKDATDDTNNPAFSTAEAVQYLQSLRKKRGPHDGT